MTELVTVDRPEAGIARLTLRNVDRRNALSIAVRDAMSDALDDLAADESLSVVVIESEGPVFSAGFDLREFDDPTIQTELWASSDRWHERLRTYPTPLIASIQGPAIAGGFDLATMCDLRVAARSATFRRPEVGFAAPIYSILCDLVGGAVARELSFTQRTLTAEEALELHLVTRVVDDAELADATMALAGEVAACNRQGLVSTKATAIDAAKLATDATLRW